MASSLHIVEKEGDRTVAAFPARKGHEAEGAGQLLQFSHRLQSTLDLESLLRYFHEQASELIPYDGLVYDNAALDLVIRLGRQGRNRCGYRLVLLDEDLGQITITRTRRFEEKELEQFETLLSLLVYPVRNALLYRKALANALTDPVTGLNNRSALEQALEHQVELARRHGNPLSLLMVDIDFFKLVNDRHGHLAGDSLLRELGTRLVECVRRSDVIFRYGGEEFSILLNNTDLAGARRLAERVRIAIEEKPFAHGHKQIPITVSVGVATLNKNEDGRSLVARADRALYQAKEAGRNQVVVAS
ncbi:MAG: GGDEF domain-containing protein [Gammaproteobacteria bacterium]|nr:MAG: GGDEF domain-containing protein [Gammaproteobacteria bacterium]